MDTNIVNANDKPAAIEAVAGNTKNAASAKTTTPGNRKKGAAAGATPKVANKTTKSAIVLKLLRAKQGASIEEMCKQTGSVCAASFGVQ